MKKYKFILKEDWHYIHKQCIPSFRLTSNGKLFIENWNNKRAEWNRFIIISKGYSWNGSDFGITTEKLYYPTLVHDALIQAYHNGLNIKRSTADKIFYNMMKNRGFKLAKLYYWAVLIYGKIFRKRKPDEGVEVREF